MDRNDRPIFRARSRRFKRKFRSRVPDASAQAVTRICSSPAISKRKEWRDQKEINTDFEERERKTSIQSRAQRKENSSAVDITFDAEEWETPEELISVPSTDDCANSGLGNVDEEEDSIVPPNKFSEESPKSSHERNLNKCNIESLERYGDGRSSSLVVLRPSSLSEHRGNDRVGENEDQGMEDFDRSFYLDEIDSLDSASLFLGSEKKFKEREIEMGKQCYRNTAGINHTLLSD